MKIKDLIVGQQVNVTLVVKSATARETKAKKPYLSLEFFDGTDTIPANYWDWKSGAIPAQNDIVDVTAKVTEWNGAKQLNVSAMRANTERILADFAPTSTVSISDTYKGAFELASNIKDDTLRTLTVGILEELRDYWVTVPGAKAIHHAYIGGTLVHSYSVARIALRIASCVPEANRDLVVAAGLLHDLGKLFTYKLDGVIINFTNDGHLLEHIFMGAEFIGNFAETHVDTDDPYIAAKVRMLRHIILAHHGSLEYGSPVTPHCIEAYIVSHADQLDAAIEQVRQASRDDLVWTDKLYTLSNKPHLTPWYVSEIFKGHEE